jgi:hypothetical protein
MWALNTVLIGQNINLTVRVFSNKFCFFLELNERRSCAMGGGHVSEAVNFIHVAGTYHRRRGIKGCL